MVHLKKHDLTTLDFVLEVIRQVRYSVGMTHENRERIIESLVSKKLFDNLLPFLSLSANL
jgi:hypothetical protein